MGRRNSTVPINTPVLVNVANERGIQHQVAPAPSLAPCIPLGENPPLWIELTLRQLGAAPIPNLGGPEQQSRPRRPLPNSRRGRWRFARRIPSWRETPSEHTINLSVARVDFQSPSLSSGHDLGAEVGQRRGRWRPVASMWQNLVLCADCSRSVGQPYPCGLGPMD
jgi:hypothetical protein